MLVTEKIFEVSKKFQKEMDRETMDELKKRIVDSIIVAYTARYAEPVKISKRAFSSSRGKYNSTIYFTKRKATVDIATFINGCMVRYQDYNDTYLSKEALHPSDNIPPILALAEAMEIDGKRILGAINTAYQVVGALSDAVSIRERGWDHVTYISISSAAGIASLLDLEKDEFIHTINLGLNNNISMRQTRAGELSMWKGCTAANASRNSVFAVLLAKEGFTGPGPIFEGEMGFFKQVSGEFDLDFNSNRVLKTMIKNYPVEYHAMSAVEAAEKIRKKMSGEIKGIDVDTFSVAYKIIVKDPEKFSPKTKETADHSLPYLIAYTLLYGEPTTESYTSKYLKDPKILYLMQNMMFKVREDYDKMYPENLPVRISVKTSSGIFEDELFVPKGHYKNPYSWDDLKEKGLRNGFPEDELNSLIEIGKGFETRNMGDILEVVRNVNSQ